MVWIFGGGAACVSSPISTSESVSVTEESTETNEESEYTE